MVVMTRMKKRIRKEGKFKIRLRVHEKDNKGEDIEAKEEKEGSR